MLSVVCVLCVRERRRVCVCCCERERERGERECVCVRERREWCVCVCKRERGERSVCGVRAERFGVWRRRERADGECSVCSVWRERERERASSSEIHDLHELLEFTFCSLFEMRS